MSFIYNIFVQKEIMKQKEEKIRHFGGVLIPKKAGKKWTPKERLDRNIEKKHLKAYLRGDKQFTHPFFGSKIIGLNKVPNYVQVSVIWK